MLGLNCLQGFDNRRILVGDFNGFHKRENGLAGNSSLSSSLDTSSPTHPSPHCPSSSSPPLPPSPPPPYLFPPRLPVPISTE